MNIPKGYIEVEKNSTILIQKGDKICLIFKKPFWIPSGLTRIYEFILRLYPGLQYITFSYNNIQHKFELIQSNNDGTYVYLEYLAITDAIPVIIIVGLCVLTLGGILGSLTTIAVAKTGSQFMSGINIIIMLIIALVIFIIIFKTIKK